jgi:hypothetical protein
MANDRRVAPVYDLRETRRARDQLDRLAANHQRFTEMWEGVWWLLQRNPTDPEVGALIPGKKTTYILKTFDFLAIGLPTLAVVYSVTDPEKRIVEIIEVVEIATTQAANANSAKASGKPA